MRAMFNKTISTPLAASAVAQSRPARRIAGLRDVDLARWFSEHAEVLWVLVILLIAGLAHGINMFSFPFYENDEGTYMAQAWAVLTQGELAQYTYWYDHSPWGWFQIAGWSAITGGFYTFGTSIDSGRVLMLIMQVASTFMVYRIGRSISGSITVASISSLMFALSAYGLYYHRRVLLDNITTFWMLLAILFLVQGRFTLTRVWLSAIALAISILSKELTVFLVPVMTYLVYYRSHASQRLYATVGWLAIVTAIFSTYPVLAALKSELFPTGTWLGGDQEHVSLIGTLQMQMSRDSDGGVFDPNSGFWRETMVWFESEPLLVLGGSIAAFLSVLLIRRHRLIGIMGLLTFSLWAFIGRGGVVIGFYLVPLLPLLALNIGLVFGMARDAVAKLAATRQFRAPRLGRATQSATAGLCLALLLPGFTSSSLGFAENPYTLWSNQQVEAQNRATEWIRLNIPHDSKMIIDAYMWLDLQDPPEDGVAYTNAEWQNAHWYWKVDADVEIREGVFHNDPSTVDYLVPTPQMIDHAQFGGLMPIVNASLENSSIIANLDSGGYPVQIRRVNKLQEIPATEQPVLVRSWNSYKGRFIEDGKVIDPGRANTVTSEGQSYALLRAVYMNDRETFDDVWSWTQDELQVRGDGALAWHWGANEAGEDGVLDLSSATDADQDAALALLFASKRWDAPEYQTAALEIMAGIWDNQTVEIGDQRIVTAGSWTTNDEQPVLNPSYFAPYIYRIFADVDPDRQWELLVDSSYDVLARIAASPELGGTAGAVPNFVAIERGTGDLVPATSMGAYATEFSYDASRLPWRLTLDWLWFKDDRALRAIDAIHLPAQVLQETGSLAASYASDGSPTADHDAISMYAGVLGGLLFAEDQDLAHEVFAEHIFQKYNGSKIGAHWGDPDNYYDQNWAWFATALMSGGLANLWEGETVLQWNEVMP